MEKIIKKASELFNQGKVEEAEKILVSILEDDPKQPDANYNLGLISKTKGKFLEALSLFKTATEIDPNVVQYFISYGEVLFAQNKLEDALVNYRKAIELKPDDGDVYNNLGATLYKLERFKEAEVSIRKAIELNPYNAKAYNNLSITLKELEKFEEAKKCLKKSIEIDPGIEEFTKAYALELNELITLDKTIILNSSIRKASIEIDKSIRSSNSKFLSPSPIEYEEFYRKGMGTENVGSFLRSLIQMVRPNKILEIGAGYTTPFILEAVVNNERIFNEGNLKESYFKNYNYTPKLVVIDDINLSVLKKNQA